MRALTVNEVADILVELSTNEGFAENFPQQDVDTLQDAATILSRRQSNLGTGTLYVIEGQEDDDGASTWGVAEAI
jgi:hypothetical protein